MCKELLVQFEGYDQSIVLKDPALAVDLGHLRAALRWFTSHNWQWIEATKEHEIIGFENLGQELEAVLLAYRDDLGGLGQGVPQSLYRAATRIFDDAATVEPC
jgi:hypothetical protein